MPLRHGECGRSGHEWRFAAGAVVVLLFAVGTLPAFGAAALAQAAPAPSSAAATGAAAPAPAAQAAPALTPAAAVAAMKSDLLRLVSANEVYFAKHKGYSDNIRSLPGYTPTAGVNVTIVAANADGWNAQATTSALPGKSCVVFIGPVKPPPKTEADGRSGSEAVPVCDNVAARH